MGVSNVLAEGISVFVRLPMRIWAEKLRPSVPDVLQSQLKRCKGHYHGELRFL